MGRPALYDRARAAARIDAMAGALAKTRARRFPAGCHAGPPAATIARDPVGCP